MRYLLIPQFCAEIGYTPKAIRRKIESGAWREGHEYRRGPDGHIFINVDAVEKWIERGRAA